MSVHRLDAVQLVPTTLDEAWAFFTDPRNLALLTPPSLRLRITSRDLPSRVYEGLIVTYVITPLLGVPMTWVTEISHLREREYFVDEQRAGPYAFWNHEHHFRAVHGGLEMRDIVHYAAPLGALGDLIVRLQVKPKLAQIFAFRRGVLERRFGTMGPGP